MLSQTRQSCLSRRHCHGNEPAWKAWGCESCLCTWNHIIPTWNYVSFNRVKLYFCEAQAKGKVKGRLGKITLWSICGDQHLWPCVKRADSVGPRMERGRTTDLQTVYQHPCLVIRLSVIYVSTRSTGTTTDTTIQHARTSPSWGILR